METVNHPQHYNKHPSGVECIDIVEHFDFNLGSAIKYIWRAGLKSSDAIEDLKKAKWYIEREIELFSIPYPNRTNVEFGTFSDDSMPEEIDDEAWDDLIKWEEEKSNRLDEDRRIAELKLMAETDDESWEDLKRWYHAKRESNRLDEKVPEVELKTRDPSLIGFMRAKAEADIRAQEDKKVFDLLKPGWVDKKKKKLMKPKVKPSRRSTRKV